MQKIKIMVLSIVLLGFMACKDLNKQPDPIENNNGAEMEIPEKVIQPTPSETDLGTDYHLGTDISPMYEDLGMSEKQVEDYETLEKKYHTEKDSIAILVRRDSALKSVLSAEQYKKYQEMSRKRKNDKVGTK